MKWLWKRFAAWVVDRTVADFEQDLRDVRLAEVRMRIAEIERDIAALKRRTWPEAPGRPCAKILQFRR